MNGLSKQLVGCVQEKCFHGQIEITFHFALLPNFSMENYYQS